MPWYNLILLVQSLRVLLLMLWLLILLLSIYRCRVFRIQNTKIEKSVFQNLKIVWKRVWSDSNAEWFWFFLFGLAFMLCLFSTPVDLSPWCHTPPHHIIFSISTHYPSTPFCSYPNCNDVPDQRIDTMTKSVICHRPWMIILFLFSDVHLYHMPQHHIPLPFSCVSERSFHVSRCAYRRVKLILKDGKFH